MNLCHYYGIQKVVYLFNIDIQPLAPESKKSIVTVGPQHRILTQEYVDRHICIDFNRFENFLGKSNVSYKVSMYGEYIFSSKEDSIATVSLICSMYILIRRE